MIKKPLGLLLTGVLTFGLAACNNNNDAADEVRTSRADRDNTILNVGNGRDDGIDHNGPLTEDYTNRDNNDPDWDRNGNNRNNNDDYITNVNNDRTNTRNNRTRNVNNNRANDRHMNTNNVNNNRLNDGDMNTNNVNYNRLHDNNQGVNRTTRNNNNNNDMNDMLNISADRTSLDSKNYPHTKAILIQHAQYRYIPFGSVQWYQFGGNQQGQAPAQQQKPTNQGPTQQAPAAPAPAPTAPAPKPAAPSPAAPAPKPAAPAPAAPAPKPAAPAPATGDVGQFVQQVIDLTNAQRSKNGLPALKADSQLSSVAQKKSVDMAQNNYFSHTSPTYGSPFDMMRDFGVTYKSAGENIAQGQRTPQEVVTAWMNSEGHRKNILSANFTHIGVGYEKSGNHWTQMFIGK
ncbi:CAP domain-containing protein [Neobacillus niacini]|uniref:CAP domain-containing protein n=1 Tax=Neobacillus niacini TaxID=86668 RepID=UPI0021AFC931|nr:CAP domain-containing protein [Neobacillus niacini]